MNTFALHMPAQLKGTVRNSKESLQECDGVVPLQDLPAALLRKRFGSLF